MKKLILYIILAFLFVNCQNAQDAGDQRSAQLKALNELEEQLKAEKFEEVDVKKGDAFISEAQKFAKAFPKDTLSPVYLFKAADVARGIGKYQFAIKLWGQVNNEFPDHKRAPEALFLQGFTADKDLKRPKQALRYYEYFLDKYREHPLHKDVTLLVQLLEEDKSIKNLVDEYKEKNKPQY